MRSIFQCAVFKEDVRYFSRRVGPGLYFHRGVASECAVAEDNVADVPVASVAVRDRSNAGAVSIGEVHVLHKHLQLKLQSSS